MKYISLHPAGFVGCIKSYKAMSYFEKSTLSNCFFALSYAKNTNKKTIAIRYKLLKITSTTCCCKSVRSIPFDASEACPKIIPQVPKTIVTT